MSAWSHVDRKYDMAGRHGDGEGAESPRSWSQAAGTELCHTDPSLRKGHLGAHPHSDRLPPTKPHPLVVPLPIGAIFFQITE